MKINPADLARAVVARAQALLDLRDVLVFGGIGVAAYGIAEYSAAGAMIFVGLMLIWAGSR